MINDFLVLLGMSELEIYRNCSFNNLPFQCAILVNREFLGMFSPKINNLWDARQN